MLERIDPDASDCSIYGRHCQQFERHAAAFPMYRKHPFDESGCGDGTHTDMKSLAGVSEISHNGMKVGGGFRLLSRRCVGEKIVDQRVGIHRAGGKETAATERSKYWFRHTGGKHGRNGGIKCVASLLQDL